MCPLLNKLHDKKERKLGTFKSVEFSGFFKTLKKPKIWTFQVFKFFLEKPKKPMFLQPLLTALGPSRTLF